MSHAYPRDLAQFVFERWEKTLSHSDEFPGSNEVDGDPLPSPAVLEQILSVCYQASLMREELRPVMLRLIFSDPHRFPPEEGPPTGLQPLIFTDYRTFSALELRRLSPAAGFYRSLVGASIDAQDNVSIWGILQSGPRWLRALRGGRVAPSVMPPYLVIYVNGPGRIEVNKGSVTVGQLRDGRVFGPSMNVFDSQWFPLSFAPIRRELIELHTAERERSGNKWAELDPDITRIIGQHTIKRIIAAMRNFQHGGTLLVVPPEMGDDLKSKNLYLALKYRFGDGSARQRFRSLMIRVMNTLAESGGNSAIVQRNPGKVGWYEYVNSQDESLSSLDEGIFEMAHLIAGLSTVDGAVVMTKRFELLGFAGEIVCPGCDVSMVARATDLEGQNVVMESTERVGTRHRSVYRFCEAMRDALGIVVSQDGGVRIISWKDGRVTYWDHQATTSSLDF